MVQSVDTCNKPLCYNQQRVSVAEFCPIKQAEDLSELRKRVQGQFKGGLASLRPSCSDLHRRAPAAGLAAADDARRLRCSESRQRRASLTGA